MKNDLKRLALSLILAPLLWGCGSQWSSRLESLDDNKAQCSGGLSPQSTSEKSLVGPFQRAQRKVIWLNEDSSQRQAQRPHLAIQVDLQCLQKNQKFNLLTQAFRNIRPRDFSRFSKVEALTIKWPQNFSQQSLEKLASETPCLTGLHEDSVLKTQSLPNDPRFFEQSHLQSIRFEKIFRKSFLGPQALRNTYTLAVIDDGFWKDHPDLKEQWWKNPNEIPGNSIDDDQNGVIDDVEGANFFYVVPRNKPWGVSHRLHGTHVSGLAAAQTSNLEGIASPMGLRVKILPIAMAPEIVLSGDGVPFGTALARAIRYAADMGAHVMNISMMAQGYHPIIEEALIYAVQKGSLVVVAAGNDSQELGVFIGSPAIYGKSIPGVITVGASDSKDGSLNPGKCLFSNYSTTHIEIFAPGCDSNIFTPYGGAGVLSCVVDTTDPSLYGWIQGTSMASPLAASGTLYTYALLKETRGSPPSPALVEQHLIENSRRVPGLESFGQRGAHLDLELIWNSIKSTPPPPQDCP